MVTMTATAVPEYKMVEKRTAEGLAAAVNDLLRQGFEPHGDPFVVKHEETNCNIPRLEPWFYQAMVKP